VSTEAAGADVRAGVVGMAASAGGVAALVAVLGTISREFPFPILVVEHQLPGSTSMLPSILDRSTALTVKEAEDGETARAGMVYVAPTDTHLVVGPRRELSLLDSAPVRFQRPSANVLFESLAKNVDGAAVVIVLSGMGSDGADGAMAVKDAGGRVMAQDEASAQYFGMPGAAIATGAVDEVLPVGEIGPALSRLAASGASA
jgi:two-component system, chemotaxis family, protein-glutamate methylesterase/glutaminase